MAEPKTSYVLIYDGTTYVLPTSEGEGFLSRVQSAAYGYVTVQLNEDVFRTFNIAGVPWSFEVRPQRETRAPAGPVSIPSTAPPMVF